MMEATTENLKFIMRSGEVALGFGDGLDRMRIEAFICRKAISVGGGGRGAATNSDVPSPTLTVILMIMHALHEAHQLVALTSPVFGVFAALVS